MHGLGELLRVAAQLTFVLLLIVLAKGWTISSVALEQKKAIFTVVGIFVILYFALLIWDVAARDPASTLYVYDSIPGYLIITLDILTGFWFIQSCVQTYLREIHPDKKRLYIVLCSVYCWWFFAIPIFVGIASALEPWVREKVVTSIQVTANTVAYALLAFIFWPTRASTYFKLQKNPADEAQQGSGSMPYEEL